MDEWRAGLRSRGGGLRGWLSPVWGLCKTTTIPTPTALSTKSRTAVSAKPKSRSPKSPTSSNSHNALGSGASSCSTLAAGSTTARSHPTARGNPSAAETRSPRISKRCLRWLADSALSGIVRGQRDLAAFAAKLSLFQLRALGSYRNRGGGRDYPKETTFQRVLAKLDAAAFERILIGWEIQRTGQVTGDYPAATTTTIDDQIAIDGKAQRGSTPHVAGEQKARLVSAQSQPSGRVPGTVAVEHKSNEIPAAHALLEKLRPLGRQADHVGCPASLPADLASGPSKQRRGFPRARQRQSPRARSPRHCLSARPHPSGHSPAAPRLGPSASAVRDRRKHG